MTTKFIVFLLCCIGPFSFGQINPNFAPIPSSFGILSANPVIATDIPYDNKDTAMQAFHLLLPDTVDSYPLVIFIHGGGFQGGSRDDIFTDLNVQITAKYFLERDIAFACIGYRLLPTSGPTDTVGVKKCMGDSKRALQFMRYYAQDLFLDPQKVALTGGSAGAGTSLWLASRDDMADLNASDPIEQMSTRVCATYLRGSQATYDLYRWETEIYQDYDGQGSNYTLDSMEALLGFDRYASFYGGLDSTYHILYDSALIQYRQDVDMLYHLSSDDPPLYIESTTAVQHPSGDVMHHPYHSRQIYNQALSANLPEVKASISAININNTFGETGKQFLERQLNSCSNTTNIKPVLTKQNLLVFPNPAHNLLSVQLQQHNIECISLFNASGQLIQTKENIHNSTYQLPTNKLPNGLYWIQISSDNGQQLTQTIRVQH